MNPLLLARIGICAALFAAGWLANGWRLNTEAAELQAALSAKTQEAEAQARAQEFEFATNARKAADAYRTNVARAQAAAASAAAGLDGLRDAIANAPGAACPAAGAASGVDAAGAFRELFGACAATLSAVAQEADRLEARLTGLQDYVRAINPEPKP